MAQKKNEKLKSLKDSLKQRQETRTVSIRLRENHIEAIEKLCKEIKKEKGKASLASVCQRIVEDYIETEMSAYMR